MTTTTNPTDAPTRCHRCGLPVVAAWRIDEGDRTFCSDHCHRNAARPASNETPELPGGPT